MTTTAPATAAAATEPASCTLDIGGMTCTSCMGRPRRCSRGWPA